ncbi:MAG: phage holin family protein [Beijerinckiaceae bacterium]
MSDFLKRQVREALAPLESTMLRLLRKAALGIVALASLFACLAFLSVAAFIWLSGLVGPIFAALALGGFYVLITLACVLAIRAAGAAPKADTTVSSGSDNIQQAAGAAEANVQSENIDRRLAPILAILQEAGLQRANIAVLLGAEVAKQVRPLVLVVMAFATGFVFGRR